MRADGNALAAGAAQTMVNDCRPVFDADTALVANPGTEAAAGALLSVEDDHQDLPAGLEAPDSAISFRFASILRSVIHQRCHANKTRGAVISFVA